MQAQILPGPRTLTKTILIVIALAFEFPGVATRVATLGLSAPLVLFLGLYCGLLACLWSAAFIRIAALRWGWALLFALAAVLIGTFQDATADAMSYDAFVTMINSAGFADDAFAQYAAALVWAAAGAAFLLVGVGLKPDARTRVPGIVAMTAPFAGLAVLTVLLFARGGEGGRGIPGAWTGMAYAALAGFEAATRPSTTHQPVRIARDRKGQPGDIVLIIDESIAARYLDINDPAGVRSGLASPPPGISVGNFGIAAAITHCSFGSNLTLRHGGTREGYQRINATMPSIFDYAKRAGFATIYIDAQRTGGAYQNGMDDAERRAIDRFVQFDDTPVVDRDMAAADTLIAALNNGRREFILINKMGAHFPVADKYPDSARIFAPALPRDETTATTDTRIPKNLYVGAGSWRLYRNSYRNTVAWTVGGFFDRLFATARLDGALIVYTSDHGQNLHERGDSGTTTHCNPAPAVEEGAVPLVVIAATPRWNAAAKSHFDASSHYRIFPALLDAMGYDAAEVRRQYGEALDAPKADPATFNRLFNARLGRKPIWVGVERAALARPPVSDYPVADAATAQP
ncbi:MAG: sulfatase-like hydrolase/transferase [Sphingopyxis sp.]|nr:sulfatase-like hydrolase/transferase [Sphingopyxis sp.]